MWGPEPRGGSLEGASDFSSVQFSSGVQSCLTLWDPMDCSRPARLPCPSPTPRADSNSCPLSRWSHPTISSSVIPFSSCLQSFPASGSFPVSQLSTLGGQSIRVPASASVLPMNIQDWSPLGWTGWISSQSKGLSRVFSNTTIQKHQFFGTQLSLWSYSLLHQKLCLWELIWCWGTELGFSFRVLKEPDRGKLRHIWERDSMLFREGK